MTTLTLDRAKAAASAAEAHAASLGKPFAVTVVDAGGHVLLVHRQDGVQSAASEVSAAKARASAAFNRPSGVLEDLMGTDGRPTPLALTSVLPGTRGVQGAVTLHDPADNTTLDALTGAIGASGGTPAEDEAVARAGAAAPTSTAGDLS